MTRTLRLSWLLALLAVGLLACTPTAPLPTRQPAAVPTAQPTTSPAQLQELQKFDQAADYRPPSGPGGTPWDQPYRSLIQTNANATAKGLPTHAAAVATIKADAAQSPEKRQLHLGYVLYVKHFSQAYRPEEATIALRQLYSDLVGMAFGQPSAPATAALPFDGDPRLIIRRDVPYGADNPALQTLDAYLVKGQGPSPVLIEIHGGGWRRGGKSQFEAYSGDLIAQVLAQGISVVSINYRLTPQDAYPAQVQDVQRAIQFIRSQARDWQIDPQRMAAIGGSAGAHLAAWIALHDDLADPRSSHPLGRQSTRLSCFVDLWGPMDLTRVKPLELSQTGERGADFAQAFANLFATTPELYNQTPHQQALLKDASPVFYVTPDDPPAMIVHPGPAELSGPNHPPIPETINDPHSAWFGVLLADKMEAASIRIVRYIGPEVGQHPDQDSQAIISFLRQCLLGQATLPVHLPAR
jgi:acetyl esterase/lipase